VKTENEDVANTFEATEEFRSEWEPWPFNDDDWADTNSHTTGSGGNWRAILPNLHNSDGFFVARWKRK